MAKRLKMHDAPPDGRGSRNPDMDEYITQLIDNPGKWAIIDERTNEKYRSVTWLKARYGEGFKFKTTLNHDTNLVEVWASYHPDAS